MNFRRTWNWKYCLVLLLSAVKIQRSYSIVCDPYTSWECDSSTQCIAVEDQCDGKPDCSDGSDEIAENCIEKVSSCPKISFICTYGACVAGVALCNGKKECADGSDELAAYCRKDEWQRQLQGQCRDFEMQCKSGECISNDDACDGHLNCKDGYDETLEVCASHICPAKSFRCGYGACISGNAACNNTEECVDGSDESAIMCNRKRRPGYQSPQGPVTIPTTLPTAPTSTMPPLESTLCFIPDIDIRNMIVLNPFINLTLRYGDAVRKNTLIELECTKGFFLKGFSSNVCLGGRWQHTWPQCFRYCSASHPKSGYSTTVTFTLNGVDVSSRSQFEPNTTAIFSCANGFEKPYGFHETSSCQISGSWTVYKQPCKQICGEVAPPVTPFSRNAINANITEVPWHVGIYMEEESKHFCSGTIISPRIVVSAAHCFFDQHEEIVIDKYENGTPYWVAAGKYFRDFNHSEDINAKKSKVGKIWIHRKFQGKSKRFKGDVAILTLVDFIPFSDFISPACIFSPEGARQYTQSNKSGYFAAWNEISTKNKVSTLEKVSGVTLSYDDCNTYINEKWHYTIPEDKFCLNMHGEADSCKGDSGSGFIMRNPENQKLSLYGVVSFSPLRTQSCSTDKVIVLTNVLDVGEIVRFMKDDLETEIKYL